MDWLRVRIFIKLKLRELAVPLTCGVVSTIAAIVMSKYTSLPKEVCVIIMLAVWIAIIAIILVIRIILIDLVIPWIKRNWEEAGEIVESLKNKSNS